MDIESIFYCCNRTEVKGQEYICYFLLSRYAYKQSRAGSGSSSTRRGVRLLLPPQADQPHVLVMTQLLLFPFLSMFLIVNHRKKRLQSNATCIISSSCSCSWKIVSVLDDWLFHTTDDGCWQLPIQRRPQHLQEFSISLPHLYFFEKKLKILSNSSPS